MTHEEYKKKRSAQMRAWRARQSPEKIEEINKVSRKWRINNRERGNELSRNWFNRLPEDRREAIRIRHKLNSRKFRANPANRPILKFYNKRAKDERKALIDSQSQPRITNAEWQSLIDVWENKCAYCEVFVDNPTQDHIVPLIKGGQHTMDNILPACTSCNLSKGSKDLGEFLVVLEARLSKNSV